MRTYDLQMCKTTSDKKYRPRPKNLDFFKNISQTNKIDAN